MKTAKSIKILVTLIVMLAFTVSLSYGQSAYGKGRLKGKVYLGKKGTEPAVGVTVTAEYEQSGTGQQVKLETKTNKRGDWLFGNLGKGWWRIVATAPGYMADKKRIDVLQYGKNPKVFLRLEKPDPKEVAVEAGGIGDGNKLFEEAKYEEALEAYQDFLTKNPDFHKIYLNIANCYLKMEKFDEAIKGYNTFMEKVPDATVEIKAKCLAAIGEIHMKKGDMKTAQEWFVKSIDLNPKDEILAYNVAEIFFSNNKNEEAIKYFTMASQIKPTWGTPHLKLGYVYLNMGDMEKAKASFKKFIEIAPDDPQVPVIQDMLKSI